MHKLLRRINGQRVITTELLFGTHDEKWLNLWQFYFCCSLQHTKENSKARLTGHIKSMPSMENGKKRPNQISHMVNITFFEMSKLRRHSSSENSIEFKWQRKTEFPNCGEKKLFRWKKNISREEFFRNEDGV